MRITPNIDSIILLRCNCYCVKHKKADQCSGIRERNALFTDLESGECFLHRVQAGLLHLLE